MDLAWRPSLEEGRALCEEHGVSCSQTPGAESRGTLAMRIGAMRLEVTSFRGDSADGAEARMRADCAKRDMTIGALLWRLHDDSIHDPEGGLDDWRAARIRACGDDAVARIAEHPIRLLRYLRRSADFGFVIEDATRRALRSEAALRIPQILPEALAEELRRVVELASPGIFFALAAEENVLEHFLPELAPLFDGRTAGRLRWHPEVSQGLHTILTLRAAARIADRDKLEEGARRRLVLGVLFHDLGKGLTKPDQLPSHPGHEAAGAPLIDTIFDRIPGLGDKRCRRFCRVVARLHLDLAKLRKLRAGTLAEIWQRDLAPLREDFALLAASVRADREGRLDPRDLGWRLRDVEDSPADLERRITRDIAALDEILRQVRGDEIAREFASEPEKIRARLHEHRCEAIHAAGFRAADERNAR